MAIDYAAMNKKDTEDKAALDKLSTAKQTAMDKQAYKGQRDLNSGRRRMQPGGNAGVLPQRIAPGGVEGTAASLGMKKGGTVMKMDKEQDKAMIKKAFKQHDMQEHKGGKGTSLKLKMGGMSGCGYDKGGKVKTCAKGGGIEVRGKTRGKMC
jgi:hypothetical protein